MSHRVLIVHYTPPGIVGGVERIIEEHIRLLEARGCEVAVVAGRDGPGRRVHVLREIDAARPESELLEEELAQGVVSDRFHATRESIEAALGPLIAASDAVVIHNAFTLHFSLPLTAALWSLSRRKMPGAVIAWSHDLAWTNPLYAPAMHPGYPWALLRVPAPSVQYVTVSEERRRELLALWGEFEGDIRVVPNGIDPAAFLRLSPPTEQIASRYRVWERDMVLLLPVRITRRKNVEAGIAATAALRARGLDVLFMVSGPVAPHHPRRSNAYLQSLKALRSELGVEDQVVFLAGELECDLDDDTVAQLYQIADALLFPSMQEGFGLPILEAGLVRSPCIVADIPVLREVGGPDVWTFDPLGTADTIAQTILQALDQRPSQLYRRILREYRWEVILERHLLPLLRLPITTTETADGTGAPAHG